MSREAPARPALPVARSAAHLRGHLLDAHHRAARELAGVPVDALHVLEHVDDDLGMLHLDHTHG
jgi:hypothetical protein